MIQYNFSTKQLTDTEVQEINILLQVLHPGTTIATPESLALVQKNSYFLLARDTEMADKIIGMGTLAPVYKPIGLTGWIEDVVVDEQHQRQGIGRTISQKLIDKAKELKMAKIDLTSQPYREAANKLYQSLGFKQRNTNVYRVEL